MSFDYDDDIRRDESDELHGHAGGWFGFGRDPKDETPLSDTELDLLLLEVTP